LILLAKDSQDNGKNLHYHLYVTTTHAQGT